MTAGTLILVKEKLQDIPEGYVVARHPEFVFIQSLGQMQWLAKNMQTGEQVRIKKLLKHDFCEYEITAVYVKQEKKD